MVQASDFLVGLDDGHSPDTAGKRTPFIAALGRQIRENEFNKAVVDLLDQELKRCGFRTMQTAPTDKDTPLKERTDKANKAKCDLLISIHFNAMGSTFAYSAAKGFSVHIQPGNKSNPNSSAHKFARLAIEELSKGTVQTNRGIVGQDLHMTRESNMPAVLVECGFMDDPEEALLMINPEFQKEVAGELARAVCRYFGVPYSEVKGAQSPIEEETKLFNTGSLTLNNEFKDMLVKAREQGLISDQWEKKAAEGSLTESEAISLTGIIVKRAYLDKI